MVNTLTKNIVVKKLQGNIFTLKNLTEDYPTETVTYSFGQLNYNSNYNYTFTKRTPEQLAEFDKQFEGMELPF